MADTHTAPSSAVTNMRVQPRRRTPRERLFSPLGITILVSGLPLVSTLLAGLQSSLTRLLLIPFENLVVIVLVVNAALIGEIVVGLIAGFRIWEVYSGPLSIERGKRFPRFGIRWSRYPSTIHITLAPRSVDDLERRALISLCGNVVVAVGAPVLAFAAAEWALLTHNFGGLLPGIFIAFFLLLPRNDALFIRAIVRGTPLGRHYISALIVNADVLGPRRPRDWNLDAITQLLENQASQLPIGIFNFTAHLIARDTGDLLKAADYCQLGLMPCARCLQRSYDLF